MRNYPMQYLKSNADVPKGTVTSTARKGDKWHKMGLVPGDRLLLVHTEDNQLFGEAAVVKVELTTFNEVIRRADENHVGQLPLPPGRTAKEELSDALTRAYGLQMHDEPYTMVHFVRID